MPCEPLTDTRRLNEKFTCSHLLLRSGEALLDVAGQFPGGDPFPHLGHVSRRTGRLPQGRQRQEPARRKEEERRRGRNVADESLPWTATARKPPAVRLGSLRVNLIPVTAS